jgi:hypothetical protein
MRPSSTSSVMYGISDAAKFLRLRLVPRVFNFLHSVEARPEGSSARSENKSPSLPRLGPSLLLIEMRVRDGQNATFRTATT